MGEVVLASPRIGLRGNPIAGLFDALLFHFQGEETGQDSRAQKNEIGIEDVAHAIVIDGGDFALGEQVLDLGAVDAGFARFADEVGDEIQAAYQARRAKIVEEVVQIKMRGMVIAITTLFETAGIDIEPFLDRQPIAERGEFHDRQVITASVKGHQGWASVAFPAAPEVLGDDMGSIGGAINGDDLDQPEIGIDLGHRHGDGKDVGDGENVLPGLFEEFSAITREGRIRREILVGIADATDQIAVADGFDIEDEIGNRFSCHRDSGCSWFVVHSCEVLECTISPGPRSRETDLEIEPFSGN